MKKLIAWVLLAVLLLSALPVDAQLFSAKLPFILAKGATKVKITPSAVTIKVDDSKALKTKILPSGTLTQLVWSVENESDVISVTQNGVVTGLKPGTAYVRLTDALSGMFARCKIVVKPVKPKTILISQDTLMMRVGETYDRMSVYFVPENVTDKTVKWTSRNPEIASVDQQTGVITAVSVGTATIDARTNGKRVAFTVRVVDEFEEFTISAVGDVVLGGDPRPEVAELNALKRNSYDAFAQLASKYGAGYFFKNVAPVLNSDDITIANLECVLTSSGWQALSFKKKSHILVGDANLGARILKESGIDVCDVENNHIADCGVKGASETKAALRGAGIQYGDEGNTAVITVKKNGVSLSVAVIGYVTPLVGRYSMKAVAARIKKLKRKYDLVIACFHWCNTQEWTSKIYTTDRKTAQAAITAGADLVLGHHRHVPAGIERYRGKYIVYDLANFVAGIKHKKDNASMIFQWKVKVDPRGVVCDGGISVIPCTTTTSTEKYPQTVDKNELDFGDPGAPINNWQPAILTGDAGRALIRRIESMSNIPIPMGTAS